MSIKDRREAYKPFEYPVFFDYYRKALSSIWRPEEVDLMADLKDWKECTNDERQIISGILRGFTQLECHIGEYWGDYVCRMFPKHEIQAVARIFSLYEVIHAQAYNYLSDSLGLNEFEAFLGDPWARQKLDAFYIRADELVSLGIFSGAGEGVSLFSSFAVLLSMNCFGGRFKGLMQIISWSVLDEQLHSDVGCLLFKQYAEEFGMTREQEEKIVEGFELVIENEIGFINNIFKNSTLDFINPNQLVNFIYYRANNRLKNLSIDYQFDYDADIAMQIRQWFEPVVSGNSSNDFFAQAKDGSNYVAKHSLNLDNIDPLQRFNFLKHEKP